MSSDLIGLNRARMEYGGPVWKILQADFFLVGILLYDQHFLLKGVLSQEGWKCVHVEGCKDIEKSCHAFKGLVMRAAIFHVQNRVGHRVPGSPTRPEEAGSLWSPLSR